jgi:hypothetical protein
VAKRVDNGVVYTPPEIAEPLARNLWAWAGKLGVQANAVYDPCCGDGALLRAARATAPEGNPRPLFYGHDIDAEAAAQGKQQGLETNHGDLFDTGQPLSPRTLLICNPPYIGCSNLSRIVGSERFAWLKKTYKAERSGSCDLAGYVLRHVLQVQRPVLSAWVVTNTIGQGATRRVGLKWAVDNGYVIVDMSDNIKWPGQAVTVKTFVLADGKRFADET